MIKRVVIFGGHIQALGLARQVKAKGIEVVIVTDEGCSVARFSRAVDRTIVTPIGDWRLKIEELELPDRSTLLFPTNDEAVEMLCVRCTESGSDRAIQRQTQSLSVCRGEWGALSEVLVSRYDGRSGGAE